MQSILIIIPTYDEKENVGPISREIHRIVPEAEILFVDDNSPDGTGQIVADMASEKPWINAIHNPAKAGLGRAYIKGFKWALMKKYELIFEMDADFSHDPSEIPKFVEAAKDADLILGSRYVNGIRITNWPLSRLLLSKSAAKYVQIITGLPVTDPTGGYKCYRREVLEEIELDSIMSNGYSFQVEMTHTAWMLGFRIREVPITFEDRRSGYSKMSTKIFKEALWIVWKLVFRYGPRRKPLKQKRGDNGKAAS